MVSCPTACLINSPRINLIKLVLPLPHRPKTPMVSGVPALIARSVKQAEVVAYEDLGPEAIRRLVVEDFPAIVANDIYGGDLFEQGRAEYRRWR